MTTAERTILGGPAGPGGYRSLQTGPGEPHCVVAGPGAPSWTGQDGEVLLTVAHLSDLHVCDAQSPARVQFLDRYADPDFPLRAQVGSVGTYRPQEMLTTQVVDAMTRAVNLVAAGPVGRAPVDVAVVTGDNTDNAQLNELTWYLRLLDGGVVHPASGDPARYEGVGGPNDSDDRYWHPEPGRDDRPKKLFGYPSVPGLLQAAHAPFTAAGLRMPWLAVHGNHDRLLQGTLPAVGPLAGWSTGDRHPVAVRPDRSEAEIVALLAGLEHCAPTAIGELISVPAETVTADPQRQMLSATSFAAAHLLPEARPPGHGYHASDIAAARAYYRHDIRQVTFLTLDTVNPHGGWEGSLDAAQFRWLGDELAAADDAQRYVVLLSHHPLGRLVNGRSGGASARVLADEVARLLQRHTSMVLWLNGHTHCSTITAHPTWWEITTPSLIDWPQQARTVELLRDRNGTLSIATTMIDHAGSSPWGGSIDTVDELAGLSRELSANVWQERYPRLEQNPRAGRPVDRNCVLTLADPFRVDQVGRLSALHRG